MSHETQLPIEKAVLVGVTLPGVTESETQESLAELARLAKTLGYEVVKTFSQRRGSLSGKAVLGAGKLKELAEWTGGTGVLERRSFAKKSKASLNFENAGSDEEDEEEAFDDSLSFEDEEEDEGDEPDTEEPVIAEVVIFDCELSPSQLANLQRATGAEVFDRTGVIVEIFSRHAKTRAAKAQVEIAKLRYLAPRIRLTGSGPGDRLGMAGEKTVELDKRKIRDRIADLRREIANIEREQSDGRSARSVHHTVALVGYTNAGKSSMMRGLTGSAVLVEDKLFATLDTTVRALHPPSVPRILISDTVGFIKKLPTDLVASFRSTLEEAKNAGHLLYVVDASDPSFRSQLETTREVLESIGADSLPSHLVLNKIDKLSTAQLQELQVEFPEALTVSTKSAESMKDLRERIIEFFEIDMKEEEIFIPYTASGAVGALRAKMRVLRERHTETGTFFLARGSEETFKKFQASEFSEPT